MQRTLITLARGGAIMPLRQVLWQPDRKGALGVMPSYMDDPGIIGAKVITVFPGNRGTPYESHQGSVLLFECENGRPLAIVMPRPLPPSAPPRSAPLPLVLWHGKRRRSRYPGLRHASGHAPRSHLHRARRVSGYGSSIAPGERAPVRRRSRRNAAALR